MDKLVRIASMELQLTNNKEVVKVAGILNKLKNYLKQLGDRDYATAVDTLRSDSWMLQQVATELRKKIKELTEAIDDGDIPSYDMALEEVRRLTIELSNELKQVNRDAITSDPRQEPDAPAAQPTENTPAVPEQVSQEQAPPVQDVPNSGAYRYTREQWDDPVQRATIFEQAAKMIKIWHPDHDVPVGKNINIPFDEFKWFKDKDFHIKQGTARSAKDGLINKVVKLLCGPETTLTEEEVRRTLDEQVIFDQFAEKLFKAIRGGILLSYIPAAPENLKKAEKENREPIKTRALGEMALAVRTADFVLPVYPVVVSMTIGLTDLSAGIHSSNKLVVGYAEFSRASAGGIPPALRRGFQRKTEPPAPASEPAPVIVPEPAPAPPPKSEVKPEPKPKSEAKPAPKSEAKPEGKVESKPKSEAKPAPPKKKVVKKKKTSALRMEVFKTLLGFNKTAGINPNAARNLSNDFWVKFVEMSGRLGAKPEDLAQVIYSESGFDPHATNVQDGRVIAKGLNQLIEKTAKKLGMSDDEWKNYENVPAEEQLNYVEKFFKLVGRATGQDGKWDSATQLYVANFAPKYVRQASNPNTILYSQKEHKEAYEKNRGLDRDKKGHITAGDLARSVSKKLPDFIQNAIARAKSGSSNLGQVSLTNAPANDNVDGLLTALFALDAGPVEKMVRHAIERKALPMSTVLVTISSLSSPHSVRMKFAKATSRLLKEMIDADTTIHSDGKKIELQCTAAGSEYAVASAVKGLCDCVAKATQLKFDVGVRCAVLPSVISKYAEVQ